MCLAFEWKSIYLSFSHLSNLSLACFLSHLWSCVFMFDGLWDHIQLILHSLEPAPILIPFGEPRGIMEQSEMGVCNHCRYQFLRKLSNYTEIGFSYIAFIDWPTKHTQIEPGKSIRLWESISQALSGHTLGTVNIALILITEWFQDFQNLIFPA